jgi:NAD-dependent SIR2 family protein deacetylase
MSSSPHSAIATALDSPSFEALVELLRGRRIVALVGAGCSTESGIPDYRGPDSAQRTRRPIQYREFVGSVEARVRYWARSTVGWRRVAAARPNAAHRALAELEGAGRVAGVITQNVDGLHQAAGSRRVVELHGALRRVRCLDCGAAVPREEHQRRLLALNPGWAEWLRATDAEQVAPAPDGDADLSPEMLATFHVPPCGACGGILKPDVVFFGENVPPATVAEAWGLFAEGEVLLAIGSSLTVYSGRRFIYRARDRGVPIAVVNLGSTRADDLAAARVEGRLGVVLPALVPRLADRG